VVKFVVDAFNVLGKVKILGEGVADLVANVGVPD